MRQAIRHVFLSLRSLGLFPTGKYLISCFLASTVLLCLFGQTESPRLTTKTTANAEKPPATLYKQLSVSAPVKVLGDTTLQATICANEFFVFNGDTLQQAGQYSALLTASDGSDSLVTLNLDVLPLSSSTANATICGGDILLFNGLALTTSGVYSAILEGANGCDSIATLNLTVLPNANTQLSEAICDGSFYEFQGDTLTAAGLYTVVFPAANGCDSIVTLDLKVLPNPQTHLVAGICIGSIYVFQGDTLRTTGTYTATLPAANGCDSIVTLDLAVVPFFDIKITASICDGETYLFGDDTLAVAGIYVDSLTAGGGCDSTVTLTLNILPVKNTLLTNSICAGTTYVFGHDTLSAAGVYIDTLAGINGCDSIVTLRLSILPTFQTALPISICQGDTLLYHGDTLTSAGTYVFGLIGENGCDSIVTVSLAVLPVATTAVGASICQGAVYDFNGMPLTNAGTYTHVLDAFNGCDSVVTLTLRVLPLQNTSLSASICPGASYIYDGDTLTNAGNYVFKFVGVNGCDSTVTLTLNVLSLGADSIRASICAGAQYLYNGDTLSNSGRYSYVFTGANGCDSTVTIVLEVRPPITSQSEITICEGASYAFNGANLTQAGVYIGTFTAANGCDSTVTLRLTVLPVQRTLVDITTCANQPYAYAGQILTQSGTYPFRFNGANGCDSVVVINLEVLPIVENTIAQTLCAGDTLVVDGVPLTQSGRYEFVFNAANQCDSIVTVQLTVLPELLSNTAVRQCEGTSYIFNGDTLTSSGLYTALLKGANGCDSTATLQLAFVTQFDTPLSATICDGETYLFGGDTLVDSGIYTLALQATGGCDSIVTLALTVLPTARQTFAVRICAGETYVFNGLELGQTGIYTLNLIGANGCDSTVVLDLTVSPVPSTDVFATICGNEAYPFHGAILTQAGIYIDTLTAGSGCDSVVVLSLNVLPVSGSALTATICGNETYLFNGIALAQSGTYTDTLTAANGCDSLVVLSLTVLPIQRTAIDATICKGETFTFNNLDIELAGVYEFFFRDLNGCDSIVSLTVSVLEPVKSELFVTGCDGTPFEYDGQLLVASGVYTFPFPFAAANGCDSIVTLHLTIYPAIPPTQTTATICAGEVYNFFGNPLTVAGNYATALLSSTGCDSIIRLTLTVYTVNTGLTVQNGTLIAEADSATYQWINCGNNLPVPGANGRSFTPSVTGSYAVIVTQAGCSSASICRLVEVVSASEPLLGWTWSLQPNPAKSYTTVAIETAIEANGTTIEVYDQAGRLLGREKLVAPNQQIDLAGFPAGLLWVRLVNEKGVSARRLIRIAE